jgi:hypothetical protein
MASYADLNYAEAHNFVEKNESLGFYWDGWDMVKWTPNPNGYSQKNGMYRNRQWGFAVKIPCTDQGTWKVLSKYV